MSSIDFTRIAWSGAVNPKLDSALMFIYDPTLGQSGGMRPLKTYDLRAVGSAASQSSLKITSGMLAASNRTFLYVQNLAATTAFVSFSGVPQGTGTATNLVLQAGSAQDDGKGGVFSTYQYTGAVYVSGARFSLWELT